MGQGGGDEALGDEDVERVGHHERVGAPLERRGLQLRVLRLLSLHVRVRTTVIVVHVVFHPEEAPRRRRFERLFAVETAQPAPISTKLVRSVRMDNRLKNPLQHFKSCNVYLKQKRKRVSAH